MIVKLYERVAYEAEGAPAGGSADPAAGGTGAPAGGQPAPGAGNDGGGGADPAPAPAAKPPSWFDGLPPDIQKDPAIAKFAGQGLDAVLNSYRNAAKLVGVEPDKLIRTDEFASDPLPALRKLGAPEKGEGYQLQTPQGVPEHLAGGENLDWFKNVSAEIGLLPKQAQALYEKFVGRSSEIQTAIDATREQALTSLKLEYGQAFDQTKAAAAKAAEVLGIRDTLEATGALADPAVFKAMARVAKMLGETGGPGASGGALSPAEAGAKARDLTRQQYEASKAGRTDEANRLRIEAEKYYAMAG